MALECYKWNVIRLISICILSLRNFRTHQSIIFCFPHKYFKINLVHENNKRGALIRSNTVILYTYKVLNHCFSINSGVGLKPQTSEYYKHGNKQLVIEPQQYYDCTEMRLISKTN